MNELRINLGCGLHAPKNWSNLDSSFRVWLDHVPLLPALVGYRRRFAPWVRRFDVTRPLPFSNGAASHIYSSHMIEHLTRDHTEALLMECHRVLVQNGRIRLMTPDVEGIATNYLGRKKDSKLRAEAADVFMSWLGIFEEEESNPPWIVRWIRRFQQKNTHKWLYDCDSLSNLLTKCGFQRVTAQVNWMSDFPDLDQLEPADLRIGSVCVEAFKGS